MLLATGLSLSRRPEPGTFPGQLIAVGGASENSPQPGLIKARSNYENCMRCRIYAVTVAVLLAWMRSANAQGTFQNLSFEDGVYVPIPDDPFGRVQFSSAMPGWAGYLGETPIDWILFNFLFLNDAGIAIWGPNQPQAGLFHGQFYLVLQNSFPVPTVSPAIAQIGTVPAIAQSIRFYLAQGDMVVSFNGQEIPLSVLGSAPTGNLYGGDISAFAGQTGELRFRGVGYLDHIQFSAEPIPEPRVWALFALGALLLGGPLRQRVKG